jgi:hypothetical protein
MVKSVILTNQINDVAIPRYAHISGGWAIMKVLKSFFIDNFLKARTEIFSD